MLSPSGDQFAFTGGGYDAVVTESGASLRSLAFAGRPLVDGFADDEMSFGGRGQLLMPWPNRVRDGQYSFRGTDYQLPLTEPQRNHASHGLARWAAWNVEEHSEASVSLQYRLMAQSGYPWTIDLHVLYDLSADGLTVTQTATNMSSAPAPYASGAHPYLTVATSTSGASIDGWELMLPAATRSVTDDRLIPVGRESVGATAYDFRVARPLRGIAINHGFTDLERDAQGVATTTLHDAESGRAVSLWVDKHHAWLQVYTGDDAPKGARRSVAVEPMTANADAFRTGEDLLTLARAGEPGDEASASWGIRAVDESA